MDDFISIKFVYKIVNIIEMKHNSIDNLKIIKSEVELINKDTKIIAVSKTFPVETINPLIDFGHTHFGENKVQEAIEKWTKLKQITMILSFT